MKTKLKENNGFAIVSVLFLLVVLSMMATAMFLYSITSLRSVRYLSDRKKAEYLAQAGVESASYAFQLAVKSQETAAKDLIVQTGNEGDIINSNKVYMVYKDGAYSYVEDVSSYKDDEIIGYYEVEIESKPMKIVQKAIKNDKTAGSLSSPSGTEASFKQYLVEISEGQRVFTATGHAHKNNATARKKAYISEPSQGLGRFYDAETGVIDASLSGGSKTLTYTDANGNTETQSVPVATNSAYSVLGEYKTASQFTINYSLFENVPILNRFLATAGSIPIPVPGGSRTIPILMGFTSGNMILNSPKSGEIKFKENQDNMVALIGETNLFVNSNVDVTPSMSKFNTLFLRGNNIVIGGDIEMYVYGFQKLKLFQGLSNLVTAFGQRYALGSVVIGTPNPETSTNTDPVNNNNIYRAKVFKLNESTGVYEKEKEVNGYGKCGKVFFGGDVFVNVEIPNVGTYRYKVFSSGDTYYFDDDLPAYEGGPVGYGIDLFKYFVDNAVASGKYTENVNERLGQIMALYYSGTGKAPTSYVTGVENSEGKPTGVITYNAMRKIDMDKFGQDTYASLIPPDATDATSLKWILA